MLRDLCERVLLDACLEMVSFTVREQISMNFVCPCVVRASGDDGPAAVLSRVIVRVPRSKDHVFWGNSVRKYASEAAAMHFARQHLTDVALVPRVLGHGVDTTTGLPWLAMEEVQGVPLRVAPKRDQYATRLMGVVEALSCVPLPFEHVGSFGEGTGLLFDGPTLAPCPTWLQHWRQLLEWSAARVRDSHPALHGALVEVVQRGVCERALAPFESRLVFRHGDLSLDNIMLLDDGSLALIDWEWCGVCDQCDVWLEAREVFAALNAAPLWSARVPVSAKHLRAFEDCKLVAMGVAYFEATRDPAELEYVAESVADLLDQYTRNV